MPSLGAGFVDGDGEWLVDAVGLDVATATQKLGHCVELRWNPFKGLC